MTFLKQWVWPIFAGFIVASIIMMLFEFANSYIYPLPEGLDTSSYENVVALTQSLPWTAFILVFLGWAVGSCVAGWITSWLAGERQARATAILTALFVLAGIANMAMLGFPLVASAIGILILAISPSVGRRALAAFEHSKKTSMSA